MFKRSLVRKQNHLPHYHYSQPGFYFITICVHDFVPYFGAIINDKIHLNNLGKITNHIHGIIAIEPSIVGDRLMRPLRENRSKILIPKIIHGFKSCVTRKIKNNSPNPNLNGKNHSAIMSSETKKN